MKWGLIEKTKGHFLGSSFINKQFVKKKRIFFKGEEEKILDENQRMRKEAEEMTRRKSRKERIQKVHVIAR